MELSRTIKLFLAISALFLGGCAAGISGSVRFVDSSNQPVADAKLEGVVVNLINTTAAVENASSSVKTDEKGNFKTDSKEIKPGTYKVEASEAGYIPVSKIIELKDSSREVELVLKQLPRGQSQSYRGPSSDRDKIINPGEVNIQPPSM
ncbi:MAG: carboxypeptidase-like regulatory domain-containing protein [Betaproteobacteria bacterium]|nr:carboxypeptidase-like regulatory domain-containing protein [Betaproteobacteria bacterium]